jgi:nucleotide-binding universal stress UspA family protein
MSGPIVVGVDGGDRSRDALALARLLAGALGSELIPLYVYPVGNAGPLLARGRVGEAEELIGESAETERARVQSGLDDLSVGLEIGASPAAGLFQVAHERSAALIVLGSTERSGLGRIMPGSTAERLLSGSSTAVAIAPSGYTDRSAELGLIGVGFDDSPSSRFAAHWSRDLARAVGASLRLIAVHLGVAFGGTAATGAFGTRSVNAELRHDLSAKAEQEAADLARNGEVQAEVLEGAPPQVLADRSRELDLLVLGSRGYGPVKSVLLGSVSSEVIRAAECPVVVVPRAAGDESS